MDRYKARMFMAGDRVIVRPYIGAKHKLERYPIYGKVDTIEVSLLR